MAASSRVLVALVCVACNADSTPRPTPEEWALLRTLRYDAAPPPANASNRVADDLQARALGQRLFFEPAFSGALVEPDNDGTSATLGVKGQSGRVSCAGCHVPTSGFVDTRSPHRQISLAAEWSQRRTPSLLDVSFASLFNWDGRRDSIWGQAIGVMESPREFNSSRLYVAEQMFRLYRTDYEALFGAMPPLDDAARFPQLSGGETGCSAATPPTCRGMPGDGADFDHLATADQQIVTEVVVHTAQTLEAYVRQLRCGEARFDRWLDGDMAALSSAEQRGAALFVGRADCVRCHAGPRFSDEKFYNVGLAPHTVATAFVDTDDHGAFAGITALLADPLNTKGSFSDGDPQHLPAAADPSLEGAFRTPSLRCLSAHPSFMHTAQHATLDEVVAFFDRGGDPVGYPGTSQIHRLGLSPSERADLVAFLGTLQGPGPSTDLLAPFTR